MMDEIKTKERDELHRAIWAIADELRGAVDGWDFKSYVLGIMFYRYISEHLTQFVNENEKKSGEPDFNYATCPDEKAEKARKDFIKLKGFFILPSELFVNVWKKAKAESGQDLNVVLDRVFKNIESSAEGTDSEKNFKGLFADIDVNSNRLGTGVSKRNEKLLKLLDGVANMQLGSYQTSTIDAFGDAYEYLMSMYASNAGKSGGEFFTPQYVSHLLVRLTTLGKESVKDVYDPACGSGSLLLQFTKILGKDGVRDSFYGQEINLTTYNLCRINMFLHGIGYEKFNIVCGDTLTDPAERAGSFEVIVSNPPYSIKWAGDSNSNLLNDERFTPAGTLAPKSKADFAFVMHALANLDKDGMAAIILFPGVLYRSGAEQKIRQYLIDHNFIDAIIQLPANLFFGTSIATVIMVLKKQKANRQVLFIDASAEYTKATNTNILQERHIEKIVQAFQQRTHIAHFAHLASYEEIVNNDYNLSVSSYVEPKDTREVINIRTLNREIEQIVSQQSVLRKQIDSIVDNLES